MTTESQIEPTDVDETGATPARKTWVTPEVSESPVNELTAANPLPTALSDGALYS